MSLEGGREGREGRGGEGRGGERRGGEGRGGEGREGRGGEGMGGEGREGGREGEREREEGGEGGRGGMTVKHIILMAPYIPTNNEELYLYNNDVTYYVITCKSAFYWVSAAQQNGT